MESYYNTTKEKGEVLKFNIKKAKGQDNIIMGYFLKNPSQKRTPSELWINLFDVSSTPLTSIRRSLTSLTNNGNLIKLEEKRISPYGRSEHFWELNKNN